MSGDLASSAPALGADAQSGVPMRLPLKELAL
jgi:hypothetical protein